MPPSLPYQGRCANSGSCGTATEKPEAYLKGFEIERWDIKDLYLKKVQATWRKYSEDFRNGDEATQENVLRRIQEAADTAGPQ